MRVSVGRRAAVAMGIHVRTGRGEREDRRGRRHGGLQMERGVAKAGVVGLDMVVDLSSLFRLAVAMHGGGHS